MYLIQGGTCIMANYIGTHAPTPEVPAYFEYPSGDVCTLISSGQASNEFGCPKCAKDGYLHCSCSHGLDSYVCEYAKT